ncbi:MAG TPA: hypothetical protein VH092_28675 [Urbifossiella sp.]|jgi:hypothetical protein|nr:hypothetical protein [Urbifossiella sp.]
MRREPAPGSNAPAAGRAAAARWRRLAALILGGGVCLAVAVVAYTPVVRRLTRDRDEHLTLVRAKGRVRLDLPAGATDIRFYQHLRPDQLVFVDFTVEEGVFLEWAARQGWAPERIAGGHTVWPRLGFGDRETEVRVADGYAYRNPRQRAAPNTVVVTYDRERRRAYYAYWSEPRTDEG